MICNFAAQSHFHFESDLKIQLRNRPIYFNLLERFLKSKIITMQRRRLLSLKFLIVYILTLRNSMPNKIKARSENNNIIGL